MTSGGDPQQSETREEETCRHDFQSWSAPHEAIFIS